MEYGGHAHCDAERQLLASAEALLPRLIAFGRSRRRVRSTAIFKIRLFQTLAIEVLVPLLLGGSK